MLQDPRATQAQYGVLANKSALHGTIFIRPRNIVRARLPGTSANFRRIEPLEQPLLGLQRQPASTPITFRILPSAPHFHLRIRPLLSVAGTL